MMEMKIATDISNRQELDEMKSTMEIFAVSNRIRQLAQMA